MQSTKSKVTDSCNWHWTSAFAKCFKRVCFAAAACCHASSCRHRRSTPHKGLEWETMTTVEEQMSSPPHGFSSRQNWCCKWACRLTML